MILNEKKTVAIIGDSESDANAVFSELTNIRKKNNGNSYYYKYNKYTVFNFHSDFEEYVKSETPDCTVFIITSISSFQLLYRIFDITKNVVVFLRFRKKYVNAERLEKLLGVPVVKSTAFSAKGINALLEKIRLVSGGEIKTEPKKAKTFENVFEIQSKEKKGFIIPLILFLIFLFILLQVCGHSLFHFVFDFFKYSFFKA